mmetsp:Transcript_46386/g.86661  ORF Transcript_46386/g.86661 Transcript_46386/m.86661 type:complete len:96 (+) Transcript_46386:78-365(+)
MSRSASPSPQAASKSFNEGGQEPTCWTRICDSVASLLVLVTTFFSALWRMLKEHVVYPLKEYIFRGYDDLSENLSPYKKGRKVPISYTEVPGFRV